MILNHSDTAKQKDELLQKYVTMHGPDSTYLDCIHCIDEAESTFVNAFVGPPIPRTFDMWARHLFPWLTFSVLCPCIWPIFRPNLASGMLVAFRLIIPICVCNLLQ